MLTRPLICCRLQEHPNAGVVSRLKTDVSDLSLLLGDSSSAKGLAPKEVMEVSLTLELYCIINAEGFSSFGVERRFSRTILLALHDASPCLSRTVSP